MKKIAAFFKKTFRAIVSFFEMITKDQISVYAAQAAFFIIVSAVPLIILIIGLARYFIDPGWLLELIADHIGGEFGEGLSGIVTEVVDKTGASLFSISIIAVLWSASRGVFAVMRGIGGAYGVYIKENFLWDILRSFLYTLVFIFFIILTLIAIVFAETIIHAAEAHFPVVTLIFNIISDCASIIMTIVLTLFFAVIFNTVAKKGRRISRAEYKGLSDKIPRGFLTQLPGAGFAALGWVLFSYCFSLYLRYFPHVSYLYGSLTTIMLLLLWIYSCMFILMLGAEVNKIIFVKWNIERIHDEYLKKKKERKAALSVVRTYSVSFGRKKR